MSQLSPELEEKIAQLPLTIQQTILESNMPISSEDGLLRFLELLECQNHSAENL